MAEIQVSFKSLTLDAFRKLNLKAPECSPHMRGTSTENREYKCIIYVPDTRAPFRSHRMFIGEWKDTMEKAENAAYEKILSFMENVRVIKVRDLHSSILDEYEAENRELKADILRLLEKIDDMKLGEDTTDTEDERIGTEDV